jgi:hypothetical protein
VLVCVGAAAAGVLGGAWHGFAVAPRRTSSGHAVHVCATGAVGTCAPRRCALLPYSSPAVKQIKRRISLDGVEIQEVEIQGNYNARCKVQGVIRPCHTKTAEIGGKNHTHKQEQPKRRAWFSWLCCCCCWAPRPPSPRRPAAARSFTRWRRTTKANMPGVLTVVLAFTIGSAFGGYTDARSQRRSIFGRLSDSLFFAPQSDSEKKKNAIRKSSARNDQIRGLFGSPP